MPIPKLDLRVPMVGQVVQAHEGQLIVAATCKCQPTNQPMLIMGINVMAQCQCCGNCYAIVEATFNRARGDRAVEATVALVARQPVRGQEQQPQEPASAHKVVLQ